MTPLIECPSRRGGWFGLSYPYLQVLGFSWLQDSTLSCLRSHLTSFLLLLCWLVTLCLIAKRWCAPGLGPGSSSCVCSFLEWPHPAHALTNHEFGDNAEMIIPIPGLPLIQIPLSIISFTCPTQHHVDVSNVTWTKCWHLFFKSVFLLELSISVMSA